MTENDKQSMRYTWVNMGGCSIDIVRRVGDYGQERVLVLSVPALQIGKRDLQQALVRAANAVCEHLNEAEAAGGEG